MLNLYTRQEDGSEVLMNMDHIIPVSKGGRNEDNVQTMCYDCNQLKGNTITKHDKEMIKKRQINSSISNAIFKAYHNDEKRMAEVC